MAWTSHSEVHLIHGVSVLSQGMFLVDCFSVVSLLKSKKDFAILYNMIAIFLVMLTM